MEKENNLIKYNNDNIVKYHNDLNSVNFKGFKEKELDIFFSICLKIKEQGTNVITFSFSELKVLSDYKHRSLAKFINDLDNIYKKLINLNFKYEDEEKLLRFVLFSEYEIDKKAKTMKIKANEKFEYILNNFMGNYTKFDLIDFVNLKSTYSKNMFKTLKQYNTGWCDITVEDFRNILDIPEKYRFSEIDKKVLKPISKELPKYFKNLSFEKIRKGKTIERIKFTWESKKEIVEAKKAPEEIEISQELFNLIKELQTLDFFKGIMIPSNIENLIKKYDEKILIQILKRARNNTYQKIKSAKYFDYVYDSIKEEAVITIKQTKKAIKKEEQYQFEKAEEFKKIDITRKELNKKYK